MKTFKENKNTWKYNFVAELDNGKPINYITIVTAFGLKCAEEQYIKSVEEQLERFNANWFSFYLESKELYGG